MRRKRSIIANPEVSNYLHITQRCVRQGYFLDDDLPLQGKFRRRRDAVLARLKKLASAFAIDILRFSFMENHMHLKVRNRPELVAKMSDLEVARRWLIICPGFCEALADFKNIQPDRPTQKDIEALAKNKQQIDEIRKRLSSVSYLMWALSGYCAKLFNLMDGTKGHFWEDRYKVKELLDDLSLLLCAFYIDLNPIRAEVADTPETSEYTSIHCQIQSEEILEATPDIDPALLPDSFLANIQLTEDSPKEELSKLPTRASDLGFLTISRSEYVIALDVVGRILRNGKKGGIPPDLPPIFKRLKISWKNAIELIAAYDSLFKCFVGNKESLQQKAAKLGGHKLRCPAERRNLLNEEEAEDEVSLAVAT